MNCCWLLNSSGVIGLVIVQSDGVNHNSKFMSNKFLITWNAFQILHLLLLLTSMQWSIQQADKPYSLVLILCWRLFDYKFHAILVVVLLSISCGLCLFGMSLYVPLFHLEVWNITLWRLPGQSHQWERFGRIVTETAFHEVMVNTEGALFKRLRKTTGKWWKSINMPSGSVLKSSKKVFRGFFDFNLG